MSEIHVTQLTTYPIKSCGGVDLPGSIIEQTGLEFDRQWMVTRANGTFLSQRTHPQLALVNTELTVEGLVVSSPDHGSFRVPLEAEETLGMPEHDIEVFKKQGKGREQGPESAEFFSEYLGVRAMFLRVSQSRQVSESKREPGYSDQTGFADGSPILLASAASLRSLQRSSDQPIAMNRFRPNVVVDGERLRPYDEDYWRDITIGPLKAYIAWACARCPVPNVDQDTGILPKPADRYVSHALQESRTGMAPGATHTDVFFGQNILPRIRQRDHSSIEVGDEVAVNRRATNRNFDLFDF